MFTAKRDKRTVTAIFFQFGGLGFLHLGKMNAHDRSGNAKRPAGKSVVPGFALPIFENADPFAVFEKLILTQQIARLRYPIRRNPFLWVETGFTIHIL
ncbi:MAG: hypothetical protein R2791_16825 [Saprospiraceae bacterium]